MTDIFRFVSTGFPEDTFSVVKFTGKEAISELYSYNIMVFSDDLEIDLKEVLKNPATFTIITPEEEYTAYGIIASFEQLQETRQRYFYRATLVPRIWQADLYRDNQLFLDKTVPDIIEEMLAQAGLTSDDYELRLTATYPSWEYICQYRESDFDFMSRWMEREGIYYYFEQTDEGDKLIITDSSTSHTNIPGESAIAYSPPTGTEPGQDGTINSFICRQRMLPKKVELRDYNYRIPTLDLKGEADVDAEDGRGTVYLYGEHFKTTEEGNALAAIRAEEVLCREKMFYGESTAVNLCPGFFFDLTRHFRDGEYSYNRTYLITEVTHSGKQGGLLMGDSSGGSEGGTGQTGYRNSFTAIPSDVQFRPERKTPKSRFYGIMNAKVDAAGDGEYAEVDDEGRYKVILPFDQSGIGDGKASRYIRMAQPYAGADYGMHFPLHKGIEVMLTFVDGDPDRPIIAGSVPNPDTMSPVTGSNQTQSMVKTGGGNMMRMEDAGGGQQIYAFCPTEESHLIIGAASNGGGNIDLKTAGDRKVDIGRADKVRIGGQQTYNVESDRKLTVDGSEEITIGKGLTHTIKTGGEKREVTGKREILVKGGPENHKVVGDREITVTGKETRKILGNSKYLELGKFSEKLTIGATAEQFVGAKHSTNLAATKEVTVGAKLAITKSASIELGSNKKVNKSKTQSMEALETIDLFVGENKISISTSGIEISACKISIVEDSNKIVVQSSGITVDGETTCKKDVIIRGNLGVDKKVSAENIEG